MNRNRPAKGKVLVVEDEDYVRDSLGEILAARGYDVSLTSSAGDARRLLDRMPVDAVLTDLRLAEESGLDLIRSIRASGSDVAIVVLTGFGTIASAVECIRAGADDYILKPAEPDTLDLTLEKILASGALRREVVYLRSKGAAGPEGRQPVGVSDAWNRVLKEVAAAAPTDSTILLLGESGTGKELVARMIHGLSPRADKAYVRVNCAAIPIEMWESEFFGHRKGAFTGAAGDREGRFKLAHRGTLFMDEIGLMPPSAQAKILRVLQDGEFDRLGDEQPTRVDVRIVAATNSDLDADVASGAFRQDLFYRLDVLRIRIPPLRERPDDLAPLTERFVEEIAQRLGRTPPRVTAEALARLGSYSWPGNVRELRNVVERALILHPGTELRLPDLPSVEAPSGETGSPAGADELNLRSAIARCEKQALLEALKRSGGVRKDAARLLGIDPRNLGYYLNKHGIDPDDAVDGPTPGA